ncbi:MAG: cold-shock protein [Chitinophagales bacterium]
MAKSRETFNKKDKQQKRQKQKQEKLQKRAERKLNAKKGKTLEEMMAYIDEHGNISDKPPDPGKKRVINAEDVQISVPKGNERNHTRHGTVQFFDEAKGFGFIMDDKTSERVFVHGSNLSAPVKASDKVEFVTEPGNRGPVAVNVKIQSKT